MKTITIHASKVVKAELDRLRQLNNRVSKQKLRAFDNAVANLRINPHATENLIHDLKPYRAREVQQQVRLYYEFLENGDIFLVWMNNEAYPHDTSKGQANDPCYIEFERLYNLGLIETYNPPEPSSEPTYERTGTWLVDDQIHVRYIQGLKFAEAFLFFQQVNERVYELVHFDSEATGYQILLLKEMIRESRSRNFFGLLTSGPDL
jgi:hypothetical protein